MRKSNSCSKPAINLTFFQKCLGEIPLVTAIDSKFTAAVRNELSVMRDDLERIIQGATDTKYLT